MGDSSSLHASDAERLFDELLELSEDARHERLRAMAADRPELADELYELQDGYERARRALDHLRTSATAAAEPGPAATGEPDSPVATYEDRGLVGRGGMGEVREVWDASMERCLALKRLLDSPAAGRARSRRRARFLEEARIAGALQHPGIVPVYALGVEPDERPYYTMPLIKGEDLGQVLERVRAWDEEWPLPRAVNVLVRVCDAMAYAHSRGVVHRDLKPANVMVGRFGEVYVMDWGLARARGSPDTKDIRPREPDPSQPSVEASTRELRTMDGDVIGTPGYMSPEQAAGRGAEVGALSDVYSVGCMLYHLLTGISPYADSQGRSRSALAVLQLVRAGPPVPVRELAPDASPELEAICVRCMERDPAARYQDMGELARDLRAWSEGRVVRAYESGAWAELRKWVQRNRGITTAVAAAVVAVIAGLGAVAWVQTSIGGRLRTAIGRLDEARGVAESRLASLQRSAYFSNIALAQYALESFNTVNLRTLLAECPPELRGWEWHYLARMSDTSDRRLLGHAGDVVAVVFSPDGGRLVSAARDLSLRVWDLESGEELVVLCGHGDLVDDADVSPDGRWIASASRDGLVRLWDMEDGSLVGVLAGHPGPVTSVEFSPDGRQLVSADQTGAVRLWDVASRSLIHDLIGHASNAYSVAFSPDGALVAVGAIDGSILLWETLGGSLVGAPRGSGGPFVREVEFSPDGSRIAAVTIGKTIEVIDVPSGRTLQQCVSSTGSVPLAYSPDGQRLYAAEFGAVQSWSSVTGQRGPAWLGHAGTIYSLAGSPDGRWVASGGADATVRLWDTSRDPACWLIPADDENVHGLAFSSRSDLIAWAGREGRITVLDSSERRVVASWAAGQDWVYALAFQPGSDVLASSGSDGSIRLWDPLSGDLLGLLKGHDRGVRSLVFDDEGRLLSSGDDGTARVWDIEHTEELSRFACDEALLSASFDPTSTFAAVSSWEGSLFVYELATGAVAVELEAHPGYAAVSAFGPLGRRIATGGGDCVVRIWDAQDGSLLSESLGHESSVTRVGFSLDGARVYSVGWDGLFKSWDATSGRPALTLSGGEQPLRALAVASDGLRIAVAGMGRTLRVWSAAPR